MNSINKYEASGILLSVVIMAMVLAFFHFGASVPKIFTPAEKNEQGAIIVTADENQTANAALADAIVSAATADGKLKQLVIDDVQIGTGKAVQEGDTVTVNYTGTTKEGVQFDSSYVRGKPFSFVVGNGRVIQGWEEGLIGMQVGGQRVLVIPADMAYGNKQVGPIAPNSTLIFIIELLDIKGE